jgi:type VI secretion system protein
MLPGIRPGKGNIMPDERLLEQIRSIEREPLRRGGNQRYRCIDSVLSHLQRILNTRQGNVPIAADYGVPDFLDFLQSFPESVHEVERDIKSAIDKFEPRLSGVVVNFIPDEDATLILRFQIIAGLSGEGGRQVLFESIIATDGRIHLHRR